MIPDTLITTYLHMNDPAQFKPAYVDSPDLHILQMNAPDLDFYRFLYRAVGDVWRWYDRNDLGDAELESALNSAEVYVLYVGASPAGYVELDAQDRSIEVAYFGLRSAYFGRGLGKHLLSYGVQKAWDGGAQRVWLHTCNLDGPHALRNYRKRGFEIYDVREEPMPEKYR